MACHGVAREEESAGGGTTAGDAAPPPAPGAPFSVLTGGKRWRRPSRATTSSGSTSEGSPGPCQRPISRSRMPSPSPRVRSTRSMASGLSAGAEAEADSVTARHRTRCDPASRLGISAFGNRGASPFLEPAQTYFLLICDGLAAGNGRAGQDQGARSRDRRLRLHTGHPPAQVPLAPLPHGESKNFVSHGFDATSGPGALFMALFSAPARRRSRRAARRSPAPAHRTPPPGRQAPSTPACAGAESPGAR